MVETKLFNWQKGMNEYMLHHFVLENSQRRAGQVARWLGVVLERQL